MDRIATDDGLAKIVDRLVALEEEKKGLVDDINAILKAAEDKGYSKKALRQVVKRRLETEDKRAEREAVEAAFDQMCIALGDFRETELGKAALDMQRSAERDGFPTAIIAGDTRIDFGGKGGPKVTKADKVRAAPAKGRTPPNGDNFPRPAA